MNELKIQNFLLVGLLLVLSLSLTGCGNEAEKIKVNSSVSSNQPNTDTTKIQENLPADVKVYEAKGSYTSPNKIETLDVKVTMKGDVVEDVNYTSDSFSPMSLRYQGLFLEGVKNEVIGKKLSEIGTFSRLNGSSLTSAGFNEAIAKIKEQV